VTTPWIAKPPWLFGDMPEKPGDVRFAKDWLRRKGDLTLRFYLAYRLDPPEVSPQQMREIMQAWERHHDDWIAAGSVKFFLDGVIETHTAAMLSPYSDDPSLTGHLLWDPEKYKRFVAELDQAHAFLSPLLGSTLAPTLFAVALLCCGLNSTITATLSGQIVMEGFLNLRIAPWLRRMVTRMIAIVPAVIVTIWAGEKATGQLLIFSQVVLSLQLPFAVVPLVMFTASRPKMGPFVAPRWLTMLAALTAAIIIALNAKLVFDFVRG